MQGMMSLTKSHVRRVSNHWCLEVLNIGRVDSCLSFCILVNQSRHQSSLAGSTVLLHVGQSEQRVPRPGAMEASKILCSILLIDPS